MPLDPEVQGLVAAMAAMGRVPLSEMTPAEARVVVDTGLSLLPPSEAAIAGVEDRVLPGPAGDIAVRVYSPLGTGPFAVVVYFHGGGFVLGSLQGYEALCRDLCGGTGAVVVSVGYRLSPEHPFPAATHDCLAATRWVADHAAELGGDPARLAVAGDSAGGNLAAVTALRVRDEGGPALRAQLLVYPVTVLAGPPTASMIANAEAPILTARDMAWFAGKYVPQADARHPHCSPALAADFSGLPPALIQVAEYDPLRDQGDLLADGLRRAGVPVEVTCYDGAVHGMWSFATVLAYGRRMMDDGAAWLADRLKS